MSERLTIEDLKVNHTYRRRKGRAPDRKLFYIGHLRVQYDSNAVRDGAHYPFMTIGKFLDWAGSDVTEEVIS